MTRLWNRWAKVNKWPEEDWEFKRDMKDLAAFCRGDLNNALEVVTD